MFCLSTVGFCGQPEDGIWDEDGDDDANLEGELRKKGTEGMRRWQGRYFVCVRGVLKYYASRPKVGSTADPRGEIQLDFMTRVDSNPAPLTSAELKGGADKTGKLIRIQRRR
jgi:hypothetical protein